MTDGSDFRDLLKEIIRYKASLQVSTGNGELYDIDAITNGYEITTEFDDSTECVVTIKSNNIGTTYTDYFNKGMRYTDILYVSPDGDGSDGSNWEKAYATFPAAYAVASSDANSLTLIYVSAGTFDFAVTGGQAIAKNIEISGAGKGVTIFKNTHATNTHVFSVSKPFIIKDCTIYRMTTSHGLVLTSGCKPTIDNVEFDMVSESAAAGTALSLTSINDGHFTNLEFHGDTTNTIGIDINTSYSNHFKNIEVADCAVGLKIQNAASDDNFFHSVDFHDNTLAVDIDAGNIQHFENVVFIGNTTNIDDEIGDSHWVNIFGQFIVSSLPQDLTGITVADGSSNAYGSYVEIIAAATNDGPFRIVGALIEAEDSGHHAIRLSADNGTSYFYEINIEATAASGQRVAINLPAGTEYIFNKGVQITAAWKSSNGNSEVNKIWLQRQYMR